MRIPFCDPAAVNREIAGELRVAFERVMAGGHLILGPEVEAFESEWAEMCDVKHCVGTGNCLDALTLMLKGYGIGPGDEVIVPANTYIATWLAVTACGALPVPVDPLEATHNIDPAKAEAAVTSRTRAILAVHLYGRVADMPALRDVADRHGLALLVDAAQAHGAHGTQLGDAAAFSFYPTKNLGALGDGGAVVTNDAGIAAAVRSMGNYGSRRKNEHERIGGNSRLDELQAAFLRVKLPKLGGWNERRRRIASVFQVSLRCTVGLATWSTADYHHLFVIRTPERDRLRARLLEQGIGTMVHYPTPPYLQAAYSNQGAAHAAPRYRRGEFPIAERLAREVLSLPCGPQLTADDVGLVAGAVLEVVEEVYA